MYRQEVFDALMGGLDGHGYDVYREDCLRLIAAIATNFGLNLAVSEVRKFWTWRSEQYDASFLNVGDDENAVSEVQEWFPRWLEEFGYDDAEEWYDGN